MLCPVGGGAVTATAKAIETGLVSGHVHGVGAEYEPETGVVEFFDGVP